MIKIIKGGMGTNKLVLSGVSALFTLSGAPTLAYFNQKQWLYYIRLYSIQIPLHAQRSNAANQIFELKVKVQKDQFY